MRPSTVVLLKIRPLPASVLPALRLPTASSSTTAKPPASASPNTVVAELEKRAVTQDGWSSNVRVQEHINKKDLFWKVSKPQRDTLKKLLREA